MKKHFVVTIALLAAWIGAANTNAAPQLVTGFVKREVFFNIQGATVADLTGSANFIGNQPEAVSLLGSFEAPRRSGAEYGQRVSGWLVPPTTGAYVLFIASDNDSELWLSADATTQNKQLIASVSGFTASRQWNKYPDTQNNAAAPVTLQAGQRYYIEALMKEDDGEDNLAVGWVLPGQIVDPAADPPVGLENIAVIPGASLGAMVDAANSTVTITTPPANVTSSPGSQALFWVQATGASDLGPHLLYQWKRNGADIEGANASAYLTPALALSDDGARFSCVVSVPGKSVASPEAILMVTAGGTQATSLRIAALPPPARKVAVSWADPDRGFDLLGTSSLGGVTPWSPVTEPPIYDGTTARVELEASGNRFFRLEREGAGTGGTVVPEFLWSAEAKPDTDVNGSSGQELGMIFNASVPGLIRAIRLYSFPGESGVR
ncbi:MAG: PA14 domain-containing protein, partial [Verrucomicrobiales bacterium]|nr:PA14 domain-containing protein [Verrucomicrobiales bacterium]